MTLREKLFETPLLDTASAMTAYQWFYVALWVAFVIGWVMQKESKDYGMKYCSTCAVVQIPFTMLLFAL